MPSKGIDCYAWIAVSGCKIKFEVPGTSVTKQQLHAWSHDDLEVDTSKLSLINPIGKFTWTALDSNNCTLATGENEINALTGVVQSGTMLTLPSMRSLNVNKHIVTFGFYDAGIGIAGLPKKDQFWVTISPDWSAWQKTVAAPGTAPASKPFTTLCLPAVHDVGMNTMQNMQLVLNGINNNVDTLLKIFGAFGDVGKAIVDAAGKPVLHGLAPDIISSLAITQKDTVPILLATGARYFEFRPAHCSTFFPRPLAIADDLYFQHALIPGMGYHDFLSQVVTFLQQNPTEIVVVQLRGDGVHSSCALATVQEKQQYLSHALSNSGIIAGNVQDMISSSIDALRSAKKRLIMLDNANQYSSYGGGNSTLAPAPIVAEFKTMSGQTEKRDNSDFAIFQCQATATDIPAVIVSSVLFSNTTNSPLVCTKPICDQQTLPWLLQNLPGSMLPTRMMAVMNDFFDGATADVCITLSQKMLGMVK